MKISHFKTLVFLILCNISISVFSQDFQGKAYYQTKTTMDINQFSNRELSPEQKKHISERMKSFLEKEYTLVFNKTESVYKEEERLEAQSSSGGFGGFASNFSDGPKYKNVKSKELLQDQEFFGKQFLIKDSLKSLNWKMTNESKQIGNYTCFKATATKTVDKFDFRSLRRGRNKGGDKKRKDGRATDSTKVASKEDIITDVETPKTIEVVAWYSPQIPINQGPEDYWGLPGLILEISADRTTILCTKIVMNTKQNDPIKKPEKGKKVSQKEYKEIVTKKTQEMREMFRGRRGNRRN